MAREVARRRASRRRRTRRFLFAFSIALCLATPTDDRDPTWEEKVLARFMHREGL